MSKFSKFMKQNKIVKEAQTYGATKSIVDENGEPVLWTFKPITSKENDEIREECTKDVAVVGKKGMFRPKLNIAKYSVKMVCKTVVEPDLFDADLQNSYGVMTPEDLLQAMVDDPGEYNDLVEFVQELNGFKGMEEMVDTAKN